jgi:hypothetical protein
MPRGFVWCVYTDDLGNLHRLRVNADYVLEASRGWVAADPTVTEPLPRGWLPRRAIGLDAEGRLRHAIVANTVSDLWTGVAMTFELEGSDQLFHTCTVVGWQGERRN